MRDKIFVLTIFLCVNMSCIFNTEAKQAKFFRSNLEIMKGKKKSEISMMIKEWNFEVLDSWKAENPTADIINKRIRPPVNFTKEEIQVIFASKGKYDVNIFLKKEGKSHGSITRDALSRRQIERADVASETFSLIRTVFRADTLVNYKVWSHVDSSKFSRYY